MASEVDICNQALANIGAEALIAALSDNTEEARYCNLYYTELRDNLLRTHPWNFALKFQTLADLGSAPSGWTYRYAYPVDCIRALEIVNTANDTVIKFEVGSDGSSGKVILTDQQTAELRYVAGVTDPNAFDVGFRQALSWAIAYHIAEPLTGSSSKRNDALTVYTNVIRQVTASDSEEGATDPDIDATWVTARL